MKLLLRKIESDLENNKMPDLLGMNLKDIVFLLENHGLKVKFNGLGVVNKQSINKGTIFQKGSIITLEMI